jgi:regulator of sigma E protease
MNPIMLSYIKAIIAFSLIVIIHEFGHFIVGKLFKIEVLEAAIGFGPKLLKKKIKDTIYAICAFPIGGYVRFLGQDPLEDIPIDKKDVAFCYKSIKDRFLTVISGPLLNYISAILLLTIAISMGIYSGTTQIDKVLEDTPAYETGFLSGDKILKINGQKISTWDDITNIIGKYPGEKIELEVERNGEIVKLYPTLTKRNGLGFLGIAPVTEKIKIPLYKALVLGIESVIKASYYFFETIIMLITGRIPIEYARPVSPIGTVKIIAQTDITYGMQSFLSLLGYMSVIIAIGNLLPVLPLDGGHLLFMIIERIRGKKVSPKIMLIINNIGTLILIAILLLAFYLDIFSPIDMSTLKY